ncbi:UNKNOWN [Stylonychia lemnae]|uniref:DUF5745 domain-containing protein n=1 Tax=Stylonychia lemnae TaxID=5949 RepID=A0A078ANW8_STYLE|nr:UNKNOWN [Stylonychia lemnae]|eukprot:CDW83002.1 UNKNOWN [Stylonychia lemnae]
MMILQLGNDILGALGAEEIVRDVEVFFSDAFYIQYFQAVFPSIVEFQQIEPGRNEQDMAENLQDLIDFLGDQIIKVDLTAISGPEIIMGNPIHCIQLLELLHDLTARLGDEGSEEDDEMDDEEIRQLMQAKQMEQNKVKGKGQPAAANQKLEPINKKGSQQPKQDLQKNDAQPKSKKALAMQMAKQQQMKMASDDFMDEESHQESDEYGDESDEKEKEFKKELEMMQQKAKFQQQQQDAQKTQAKPLDPKTQAVASKNDKSDQSQVKKIEIKPQAKKQQHYDESGDEDDLYNEDFEDDFQDDEDDEYGEEDEELNNRINNLKPQLNKQQPEQNPQEKVEIKLTQPATTISKAESKPEPQKQAKVIESDADSDEEPIKTQIQPIVQTKADSVKANNVSKKSEDDEFKDYDDIADDDYDEEFDDGESEPEEKPKQKIVFPPSSQPAPVSSSNPPVKKVWEKKDPLSQFVTIKKDEQPKEDEQKLQEQKRQEEEQKKKDEDLKQQQELQKRKDDEEKQRQKVLLEKQKEEEEKLRKQKEIEQAQKQKDESVEESIEDEFEDQQFDDKEDLDSEPEEQKQENKNLAQRSIQDKNSVIEQEKAQSLKSSVQSQASKIAEIKQEQTVKQEEKVQEQPKRNLLAFQNLNNKQVPIPQSNPIQQKQQPLVTQDQYTYDIDLTKPIEKPQPQYKQQPIQQQQHIPLSQNIQSGFLQQTQPINQTQPQIQKQPEKELQIQQLVLSTQIIQNSTPNRLRDTSNIRQNEQSLYQAQDEGRFDIQISKKSQQNIKEHEDNKRKEELKQFENYILRNLENLDLEDRHQLLEYMEDEYDKNPGLFPFPKELLEEFLISELQKKKEAQLKEVKRQKKLAKQREKKNIQSSNFKSHSKSQNITQNNQSQRKLIELSKKKAKGQSETQLQEDLQNDNQNDNHQINFAPKYNKRPQSGSKLSNMKQKKIQRPQSAMPRDQRIDIKMPTENSKQYQDMFQSKFSSSKRPTSSKRSKSKKRSEANPSQYQINQLVQALSPKELKNTPMFMNMQSHSPTRSNKENQDLNFVDDDSIKHMSKEQLQELFKKQQRLLLKQQFKPVNTIYSTATRPRTSQSRGKSSSKRSQQKKENQIKKVSINTNLQSYVSNPFNIQKQLTDSIAKIKAPQGSTMINNFFLNFNDLLNNQHQQNSINNQLASNSNITSQTSQDHATIKSNNPSTQPFFKISDQELVNLLQAGQIGTFEKQNELKTFLEQKIIENHNSERNNFYQKIYDILQGSVNKTYQRMSESENKQPRKLKEDNEDIQRILKQKGDLENLFKQYNIQDKKKDAYEKAQQERQDKIRLRELKMQQIQEKKLKEQLDAHQKKVSYERENQQRMLSDKIMGLATKIEKQKLLTEKKELNEQIKQKQEMGKNLLMKIDSVYNNKISMLKDKIKSEKFDRQIASSAQREILDKMKRENLAFKKMVGIPTEIKQIMNRP